MPSHALDSAFWDIIERLSEGILPLAAWIREKDGRFPPPYPEAPWRQVFNELTPSKMAYFGAGAVMLRQMMKDKEVASLEELIALSGELGVKFVACEMSMDVMGVRHDELVPDVQLGGVATFLADATKSRVSLFV